MRKKKLILTKETVKNLTLDGQELAEVSGARGQAGLPQGYLTGSTNMCPNTGSTCHSCGGTCLGCGAGTNMTPLINPTFIPGV